MTQILYSTIRPDLKRVVARRGLILAVVGTSLFMYVGVFMPLARLEIWGMPAFFFAGILIALGLKPYRRLTALENHPHGLKITAAGKIQFSFKGKPYVALLASDIQKIKYRDAIDSYGVMVTMKEQAAIQKLDARLDLDGYLETTRRRYGCDLFFPLFSEKSYEEFKSRTAGYRAS